MSPRRPPPALRHRAHLLIMWLGVLDCAHRGEDVRDTRPPDPAMTLVKAKCASCHPLPEAHSLPSNEFPDWLASHRKRVPLDEADLARIQRFLLPENAP